MTQSFVTKLTYGLLVTAGLSIVLLSARIAYLSRTPTEAKNGDIETKETQEINTIQPPTYNETEEATMAVNAIDFLDHINSGKNPADYDRQAYIDRENKLQSMKLEWNKLDSEHRGLNEDTRELLKRLEKINPDDDEIFSEAVDKYNKKAKEAEIKCKESAQAGYDYGIYADSTKKDEFADLKDGYFETCERLYKRIKLD